MVPLQLTYMPWESYNSGDDKFITVYLVYGDVFLFSYME